ncbi:MAG: MFS transporter [Chloroflexota bacterium]
MRNGSDIPQPGMAARAISAFHAARSVYYGWIVVITAGALLSLMAGPYFHGAGTFISALDDEFGWSRTLLAGAFSFSRLEGSVVGPVTGWLTDRFGTTVMVRIGFSIMAAGFVILSLVDNVVVFYVAFITIAVGGGLGGFLPVMTAVNNWFTRRKSTAMALTMAGTSAGGLLVTPIAWGVDAQGWRGVAIVIAVVVLVASWPMSRIFRRLPKPEELEAAGEETVDSNSGDPSTTQADAGFTAKEALRTRTFWLLAFAHMMTNMSLSAVVVHSVPHLRDIGVALGLAGVVVTTYTLTSLAFQLLGGFMGDRVSKRYLMALFVIVQGVGVLILAFTAALPMAFLFAVLFGMGFGGRGPLMHALRADYFGRKAFGTLSGINSIPLNLGMVVAPVLVGAMFDIQDTYRYGFAGLGILSALAALLVLAATKPSRPGVSPEGS